MRKYLLILASIFFIAVFTMLLLNTWKNSPNLNNPTTSSSKMPKEMVLVTDKSDLHSGIIVSLPWERNHKFLQGLADNNVFLQMAAYRTVLPDPLPGEEYNVHLAAKILCGTVIYPDQIFSQNEKLGPYTELRGYKSGPTYFGSTITTTIGGGVCKVASTLYNVAILSNLEIIERHPHSMPVPYVPYGQDATVAYGMKDFKFRNTTTSPILIWAEGIDNTLYIAFYGRAKPPKVEWHHEITDLAKKHRIYRNNITLPTGSEKVVIKGMDGGLVKSWITIRNNDGTSKTKELGQSYYFPIHDIVEKGPDTHSVPTLLD